MGCHSRLRSLLGGDIRISRGGEGGKKRYKRKRERCWWGSTTQGELSGWASGEKKSQDPGAFIRGESEENSVLPPLSRVPPEKAGSG